MCDWRRAPEERFGTLQQQDVPHAQQVVCASTNASLQRLTHLAQGSGCSGHKPGLQKHI